MADPQSSNSANYTGSVALIMPVPGSTTLTQTGGGAFNLLGIDLANGTLQSYSVGGAAVEFTGYFANGGTITQSFTLPSDDLRHTFTLSGFSNLSSMSLVQSNNTVHFYHCSLLSIR